MTTYHQADVLGEAVDQVEQSWTRVWVTGHHQALRSRVNQKQELRVRFYCTSKTLLS